jgi:hypothetical protein
MDIEPLCKKDFVKSEPTVRFYKRGLIVFNRCAVVHLSLFSCDDVWGVVSLGKNKADLYEFVVWSGGEGWKVRPSTEAGAGGCAFNNAVLAQRVIDTTWNRCQSHPVGANKPDSMCFRIARVSVDDGKNKNVYALLRK